PGTSVSFIAAASGVPTPTVQWQRSTDGGASFTNIAGATSTTYTFTAVAGDNGNQYRAVFTNVAGSATSTAATLTVGSAPTISSANTTSFAVGVPGSFTVTTSGFPNPTLTTTGTLPAWLSFTDNGNGTASLAGTPPSGSGGTYSFTINADNGNTPSDSQAFTLAVDESPTITSTDHTTFLAGTAGNFLIATTAGFPVATTLSETGALPSGVSFTDNGDGTATLAGTPASGTAGTYPFTISATNGASPATTQTFTLTVLESPVITSADHATFVVGSAGTFTVTTASAAAVTITKTGALPTGVSFHDNGDGTATLGGTPASGTGGTYPISITASDGSTPDATQAFTLTVNQPPAITSADHATFTLGAFGSFTVTTAPGFPTATTIIETGALPSGVSFTDNGDGTAALAGTPTAGGTYPVTIKASNGVAPDATQSFTLTVNQAPDITSADHTTFAVGSGGTFTVTTAHGVPSAVALTLTGTLPSGVSFHDNGDGTATLAGTPAAGTGGSYSLSIKAANTAGFTTQSFTLTVTERASVTSADHTTFVVGSAGSFTVTTTAGFPTATTITETGALPSGVSFTDNGDGTATLAGTPAPGTVGSYPVTISATNTAGTRQQAFTLTVQPANAPPVITSVDHATFAVASAGSFTVTTTAGYPTSTPLTETGALPSGVSFHDNNNGTATLAGTPAAGTGGTYPFTITASNGVTPNPTQAFTLTVNQKPAITSSAATTFTIGTAGSFAVTTAGGFPTATVIAESGALPSGVSFTDNGDGTATLAGTPAAGTAGSYLVAITATNAAGSTQQKFTLTVGLAAQTITFAALIDRLYGAAPFTLSATATSHLAVTYTSSTPKVCTVTGATVTLKAAGTCTITASQAGDTTWQAAAPVTRSFILGYAISNLGPPNKSTFKAGSTIPVKFQLTGANGKPIPNSLATTLGCTVKVTFNAGTPVRATYNPTSQQFQANLSTPRNLPPRTAYNIVITVSVSTTTVAAATTTVITK
ncbi:MAG TPA: putative Ig domain-containing protein, partial [Jatrophihabitans sp.]|uniref:putative Ig domain-containing protein n=1 Tax=Jatrophihabitans sp. TaxID=1932789 RepID=UPI002DFE99EE|nr:putative Ig domain-containing protein [Jatrophihabitans sp.]